MGAPPTHKYLWISIIYLNERNLDVEVEEPTPGGRTLQLAEAASWLAAQASGRSVPAEAAP